MSKFCQMSTWDMKKWKIAKACAPAIKREGERAEKRQNYIYLNISNAHTHTHTLHG